MRQRGSRRVRPRVASNDESSVDSSMLELASRSDQLSDVTTKKNLDADENVTEMRTASNDDVTIARGYLNERRTKSERYFL